MWRKKKLFAVALAVALTAGSIPASVFAARTEKTAIAASVSLEDISTENETGAEEGSLQGGEAAEAPSGDLEQPDQFPEESVENRTEAGQYEMTAAEEGRIQPGDISETGQDEDTAVSEEDQAQPGDVSETGQAEEAAGEEDNQEDRTQQGDFPEAGQVEEAARMGDEEAEEAYEPGGQFSDDDQSPDDTGKEIIDGEDPAEAAEGQDQQNQAAEAAEGQDQQNQAAEGQDQQNQAAEAAGQETQVPGEELTELVEIDPEDEILNIIPAMSAVLSAEGAQYCEDLDTALQYVRGKAYVREESIKIQVPAAVYDQLDLIGFSDVLSHTGTPQGGDYLVCSILSFWVYTTEPRDGEDGIVQYELRYHDDAAEELEAGRETARLVDELGLKDSSKSEYDKAKAIHDYIVETVEYDYNTLYGITNDYTETYSGYGAMVRHLAVCQGFSAMFYRLALEAGLDARIITSGELKHAWNIVQLDGLYYLMDCTWDENTNSDGYFLRGKNDFAAHENSDDDFHTASFEERYPLADYKYGFSLKNYGQAPDYTLITSDHRTISLSAKDGRAKAVVFFFDGCGFTEALLDSLRQKTFSGVDLIFAYMLSGTEQQQNIISEIGRSLPTDIPGSYTVCSNNMNALNDLEEMAGIRDPQGYVHSPTIFLINSDNQVIYANQGDPGSFDVMIRDFLEDPDAPDQPAQEDFGPFTAMGNCGDKAVWHFYEDGTLRISGEGKLWDMDYSQSICTPIGWVDNEYLYEEYSFARENIPSAGIKKIIIDSGITHIGDIIFWQCENLQSVTFRGSLPTGLESYFVPHDITIYFPDSEPGWNNIDKTGYGTGTKWISQDADGVHHHKWGSWTVTKAATVHEEGSRKRTCTECRQTQTQVIEKRQPVSIESAQVTFPASIVYKGTALKPAITVKVGSTTLKAGTDYTAVYSNNTNAGKGTVKITGRENYTGTVTRTFTISRAAQTLTVKASASPVSVGKTAAVTVSGAKGTVTYASSDKTIATVDTAGKVTARKVGTVKITATSAATTNYNKASKYVTIKVVPAAPTTLKAENLASGVKLTWTKVTGATGYKVYRGSTLLKKTGSTTLTFTDSNARTNGTKYTYKVVAFAGTGDSRLSKSVATYQVTRPTIASVTNSAARTMTVKWNSNAKATGYQIQYSLSSSFASGNKTAGISKYSIVTKAITGLTKGKKYYVRIRAYKTVSGTTCYSPWSAVKNLSITK